MKRRPLFIESESVTAFWVSPRFKYPRNQNVMFLVSPSGDTQNTNSKLNKRLEQVHLMLEIRIHLREKVNNCLKLHSLATKKPIICA